MSKYILLIVLPILLQLFTVKIYSQSGNAKSLEIGNMWIYRNLKLIIDFPVDTSYVKEMVVEDTLINGTRYAIINRDSAYYTFERADSMKVYEYNNSIDSEFVLIDFSQQDTSDFDYIIEVDTISFWNEIRIKVCIDYWHSINDYSVCYTEGIGQTASFSSGHGGLGYSTNIVAALLSGIKYGDTVLVDVKKEEQKPSGYELFQNYPNPFNPITTIKFAIPYDSYISLSIYNVQGEKIKDLINEELKQGIYKIKFDASNISSGVYFYQLRAKNFIKTKKLLFIK